MEVSVHYPGEISGCANKLALPKGDDEAVGEVSRDHSKRVLRRRVEQKRQERKPQDSTGEAVPEKKIEISEVDLHGSSRKLRREQVSGANSPGTEESTDPSVARMGGLLQRGPDAWSV